MCFSEIYESINQRNWYPSTLLFKLTRLYGQGGLKYTGIFLQTLQDKDLILNSENNISGGSSAVMGDRYVKSDENKKIFYMDATLSYGHSMNQPLPYDEIEMWHGHPDLYMNISEKNFEYSRCL